MTLALYGKSRRRQWMLVALALVGLLGALSAAVAILTPAGASSVTPTLVDGNPTCAGPKESLGFAHGFKPNPSGPNGGEGNPSGTFPLPNGGSITVTENGAENGLSSWSSTFPILAVIVKGGSNANVYYYTPGGSTGDTNLVTPNNPSGGPAGLSHVEFCWNTDPTATPTATPTNTPTPDPEIDIDKSNDTGDNVVLPGEQFNWIIKVTVSGAATDEDTSITDGIPGDFQAGAPVETSDYLNCSASVGNVINCTLAKGAPVGDYTITVPVTAWDNPLYCDEPITNTAYAKMGTEPQISDDDTVTINCGQTIVTRVRICKVFDDNGDGTTTGDTTFNFKVDYVDSLDDSQTAQTASTSITVAEGEGPECKTLDLNGDVDEADFMEYPGSISDAPEYPKHDVMGGTKQLGSTVSVNIFTGEGCEEAGQENLRQEILSITPVDPTCTVTFYNKSEERVSPTGDLRIEKYLDLNGDGDANDAGEGPIAAWNMTISGPEVNGSFPTNASGFVSFSGLNTGDSYTVTEALPAGWKLTNVKVDGANSAVTTGKTVTIPEGGTRVVAYYNQPLVNIQVIKTIQINGINVVGPNWTFTLSGCGITPVSQTTNGAGVTTFSNLPAAVGCTYVVTETLQAGYTPVTVSQNANPTTPGSTAVLTFVNIPNTDETPTITPTPETPTTTPTPETPTTTVTQPTTKIETPAPPKPEEKTAGERTPGPTPIAPSTGDGTLGASGRLNILLILAGMAALTGGTTLVALGRKTRR